MVTSQQLEHLITEGGTKKIQWQEGGGGVGWGEACPDTSVVKGVNAFPEDLHSISSI